MNYSNGTGEGGREDAGRTRYTIVDDTTFASIDNVNNGKLITARINVPIKKVAEIGLSFALNQLGNEIADYGIDNEGIRAFSTDDPLNEFTIPMTRDQIDEAFEAGVDTIPTQDINTGEIKDMVVTQERKTDEVKQLMNIYEENLRELLSADIIHDHKVKIRVIGRINLLPDSLQKLIKEIEMATDSYDSYYLNVALAYGGRAEIVYAAKEIGKKIRRFELEPDDISEEIIEKHLYTAYLPQPDPDLIIRTSEMRLSNFLVWQGAYSELFIIDVYWPDFREIDLHRALRNYQKRQRRYGS